MIITLKAGTFTPEQVQRAVALTQEIAALRCVDKIEFRPGGVTIQGQNKDDTIIDGTP